MSARARGPALIYVTTTGKRIPWPTAPPASPTRPTRTPLAPPPTPALATTCEHPMTTDDTPPECIHHLAICNTCGGLDVVRLDALPGITKATLTLNDGTQRDLTGATFYLGPATTPCDADTGPDR